MVGSRDGASTTCIASENDLAIPEVLTFRGQIIPTDGVKTVTVWGCFPAQEAMVGLLKLVVGLTILNSLLMMTCACLQFYTRSWGWGAIFVVMGIVLPLYGLFGITRKDESFVLCFGCFNCLFVLILVGAFLIMVISTIAFATDEGPYGCGSSEYFMSGGRLYSCRRVMVVYFVLLLLNFVELLLYGICAFFSYRLANSVSPLIPHQMAPMDTFP